MRTPPHQNQRSLDFERLIQMRHPDMIKCKSYDNTLNNFIQEISLANNFPQSRQMLIQP